MAVEHPFNLQSDEWADIRSGLEDEEKLGMLALEEGIIENGTVEKVEAQDLYLGPAERARGNYVVIPSSVAGSIWDQGPIDDKSVLLSRDQRNDAEFYLGSRMGSPVEIKYDEDMPDSEDWHSHTSFEAYVPSNGQITLGLISNFESMDYVEKQVEEGEVFVVDPYVQHKVVDKQGDPDLAVMRYGADTVAKFDLEGNLSYPWTEDVEFERRPYESGEDYVLLD